MSTSLFAKTVRVFSLNSGLTLTQPFRYMSTPAEMVMKPSPAATEAAAQTIHQPRDPNTLSNYNAWRTKHTTANFAVDFEKKSLIGTVQLKLQKLSKAENRIVLDTRYRQSSLFL